MDDTVIVKSIEVAEVEEDPAIILRCDTDIPVQELGSHEIPADYRCPKCYSDRWKVINPLSGWGET